ncbi:MAG: hypothetical protein JWO96_499 [Candidatus Saccharibacteria bacterium]|nr:hypothetical protein [Candidatus Saccharibacteria bacterium]
MSENAARRTEILKEDTQPNSSEGASGRLKTEIELLGKVAMRKHGQIAYIGRLVVAVPDGLNWRQLYNSKEELVEARGPLKI